MEEPLGELTNVHTLDLTPRDSDSMGLRQSPEIMHFIKLA